jgi:Tfp pilus assembly protein PilV
MIYRDTKNKESRAYRNKEIQNEFCNSRKNGFTLVEVVLILVLVGGVFIAFYSIFGKTIIGDKESGYEIIASNLAQEGVEIVRNIRDENILKDIPINSGLGDSPCYPYWDGSGSGFCSDSLIYSSNIEKIGKKYQNCSAAACSLGDETVYNRTCHIENLKVDAIESGEKAFAVSCVVEWTGLSGIHRKARAMTILTNWYNPVP